MVIARSVIVMVTVIPVMKLVDHQLVCTILLVVEYQLINGINNFKVATIVFFLLIVFYLIVKCEKTYRMAIFSS